MPWPRDTTAWAAGKWRSPNFAPWSTTIRTIPRSTRPGSILASRSYSCDASTKPATQFLTLLDQKPSEALARKALFRAGEASYFAGKLDPARKALNQFVERFSGDKLNAYVLAYLADIALEKTELAEAQKLYERCLNDYPDGPLIDDCRFGLARAMEDQGHRAEARKQYQALVEKTGSAWADQAQYRLGRDDYAAGEYQKALDTWGAFDKQLATSPLRPQARLGRAQALFQLKRYDEAQTLLGELADKTSLGVEARYWLGLTLKAREHWPAAAEALLQASTDIPAHPLAPAIAFHAGDALLRSGKSAEALAQFNRLLERWPKDELADDALLGKLRAALAAGDGPGVDAGRSAIRQTIPQERPASGRPAGSRSVRCWCARSSPRRQQSSNRWSNSPRRRRQPRPSTTATC